jgi:hypothetical protein
LPSSKGSQLRGLPDTSQQGYRVLLALTYSGTKEDMPNTRSCIPMAWGFTAHVIKRKGAWHGHAPENPNPY